MGWFTHHLHTHLKASWSIGARRLLSESGFSLTEVMAAVVVFSCGLVGLVLRFRNNVMVGLPFFHQSIGSPALVTWTLIVKRST